MIRERIQLHEQKNKNVRLFKIKNKISKTQNVNNFFNYENYCVKQNLHIHQKKVFFTKKILKIFIASYMKSTTFQTVVKSVANFYQIVSNSSFQIFESSTKNFNTSKKNSDKLIHTLLIIVALKKIFFRIQKSTNIRLQNRKKNFRKITFFETQNSKIDIEKKMQKLEKKFEFRKKKLKKMKTNRIKFLKCAKQFQTIFEPIFEIVFKFQSDRNNICFINIFRIIDQFYNVIIDEIHRLKNFS